MPHSGLNKLSSSIRTVPPEITLKHALPIAHSIGMSRYAEITWLDYIGVPVFASIRPDAVESSLCVNSGKGFNSIEALVGCIMESIEFGYAEIGYCQPNYILKRVKELAPQKNKPESILDYCPKYDAKIDLNAEVPCYETIDLITEASVFVPWELVLLDKIRGYQNFFGTSSNGLCSGNNSLEGTLHGIFEILERDIQSFEYLVDSSVLVPINTLEGIPYQIFEKISNAGFNLQVRYVPNRYDIPYFQAYIYQPFEKSPYFYNVGYGCHPLKEIALVRAICEAIQGRLVNIHGGRDDVIDKYNYFGSMKTKEINAYRNALLKKITNDNQMVQFEKIEDWSERFNNLPELFELVKQKLQSLGVYNILRIQLNQPDAPIFVGKIIIPTLEFFEREARRVGPRIKAWLSNEQ